jgi:formate-dependent nitrite reductase membrane component NrfD
MAMSEIELFRHSALDPTLHVWGWEIAVYLFLGGLAAGVMVIAAAARKHLFILAAPAALSLGMLALFIDLEQKLHVFRFYTAWRLTSPMSWGAWILLLIYPATLLYAFRPTERLRRINMVLGAALGAYTGILLATLNGRAAWSSLFLAPLFLASGVSAAAALAMLLPGSEHDRETFRRWDVLALGAEVVLLGLFFLDLMAAGGARGRSAVSLFFGGPYTSVFWSLVVIAGLLVPLLIEWVESRRRVHIALAPALVLIGGLSLRWIFVLAGQSI